MHTNVASRDTTSVIDRNSITECYVFSRQVKKSEWKNTEIWKAKGKGDGHQHGRKPRITEPVLIARKLT